MEKIWEFLIVGSGPGGAVTALSLAEAGRDVLLLEEGEAFVPDEKTAFGLLDLVEKYRSAGITLALGQPKTTYVEGALVGGGSEINAGLYHRTPPEILNEWAKEFGLKAALESEMAPHFEWVESLLGVTPDDAPPEASRVLEKGASALQWKCVQAPRWIRGKERQSMSRTALPQATTKGATLKTGVRVEKLIRRGDGWEIRARTTAGSVRYQAKTVYLCAGAIQTPALLLKSGIRGQNGNVGRGFQVHPSFKFVAKFGHEVNAKDMGIPSHQVKEFSPLLSMGGSISTPAHLGAGLADYPEVRAQIPNLWKKLAIYYVMVKPKAVGRVRVIPFFKTAQAFLQLVDADLNALADGAMKLGRLLFRAGATELYPSLERGLSIRSEPELDQLTPGIIKDRARLMTIHLFASCPMGEDPKKTVTDSYGKVRGESGLFINDASLLCSAPGVNPQGSLMAFARRNVLHLLKSLN